MSWRPGEYGWVGDECLRVVAIDEHGSTKTERVARASCLASMGSRRIDSAWHCPECGCAVVHRGESIPLRLDPRCADCQCPPTQRDPSLPPAEPQETP